MKQNQSTPKKRSDGTLYGLRKQLPWDLDGLRILSLDGGGIRGILPAKILALCEENFTGGRPCGEYFDYIAGTSTGGIIALGLSVGLPASAILDIYLAHGAEIFPPRIQFDWKISQYAQSLIHFLRDLVLYKYDRTALTKRIEEVLGKNLIGNAERRLVIPSFDEYNEVTIFKTPHHPDYELDWHQSMVDVALSTSAAPTFFSTYRNGDRQFADGGVWANNPVMQALADAMACYQVERHQIEILSLGCVESEFAFTHGQVKWGGLLHWRNIISGAMRLQSQNAIGQAGLLIGRDRLARVDAPPMKENPIALDDFRRASAELPALAEEEFSRNKERLQAFFASPRPPFKAYHGPRAS